MRACTGVQCNSYSAGVVWDYLLKSRISLAAAFSELIAVKRSVPWERRTEDYFKPSAGNKCINEDSRLFLDKNCLIFFLLPEAIIGDGDRKSWDLSAVVIWDNCFSFRTNCAILTSYIRAWSTYVSWVRAWPFSLRDQVARFSNVLTVLLHKPLLKKNIVIVIIIVVVAIIDIVICWLVWEK